MSRSVKAAHLTLTAHHLYYLLSQFETLGVDVGPVTIRLESLHNETSTGNYVSFLEAHRAPKQQSDKDSMHSVSSVRSVMSGMSAFWSTLGLGSSASKTEKAKVAFQAEIKYLYSAFTKIPSLRLAPDRRARLIRGYEEFPFETAVPLIAFKNVQQLEIVDIDFRQFYGWDRLAEQLCFLTVKRAQVDDPANLITNIVLDDAEKRRRRSNRGARSSPTLSWTVPSTPMGDIVRPESDSGSPIGTSPQNGAPISVTSEPKQELTRSVSPKRPPTRPGSSYRHVRSYSTKAKRSGSGSSNSSDFSLVPHRSESLSNFLGLNVLPTSKWQRLKYLSLADNALTQIQARSLLPLAGTLRSLSLASNLFAEIPDGLGCLTRLMSLDLSNCMITSLSSLLHSPLPAIVTLKLRSNRLRSLAGIERLVSLENLNVQDNLLTDPIEAARLTGMPNFKRLYLTRNPFVRSVPDYRIKIFNLFRRTPGYINDIYIEDTGPTSNERKYLTEQVPEQELPLFQQKLHRRNPTTVTFSDSAPQHKPPEVIQQDLVSATPESSDRPAPLRRRTTRRRIVDLANEESSTPSSFPVFTTQKDADPASPSGVSPNRNLATSPKSLVSTPPKTIAIADSSPASPPAFDSLSPSDGSDYRARVEALRQEFGSTWITALNEHIRTSDNYIAPPLVGGPPPFHRTTSQVVVTGSKDLS